MPTPCSLRLDVYLPGGVAIDWTVTSDADGSRPYLLAPANYDTQEIDPITGGATIGTCEVGVIDPNQTAGDQTTGFMTARVGSVRGRRCLLRRYVNATIGWVKIADGPAGVPRLDASYSAYRWAIRDVREIERKQRAFSDGRSTAIAPFGPLAGFGDLGGGDWLLDPVYESPLVGEYAVNEGSMFGIRIGYVDIPWTSPGVPIAAAVVSEDGEAALQTQGDGLQSVAPNADILWRVAGSDDPWNVARPSFPSPYTGGQIQLCEVADGVLGGNDVRAITRVYLWAHSTDPEVPYNGTEPFGASGVDGVGEELEIIVRHRGAPTGELPYYFEGLASEFLTAMYRGELSGVDPVGIEAAAGNGLYDPALLNVAAAELAGTVAYDQDAVDQLALDVLIRETEEASDARDYSESKIYGPSGWIPALDVDGAISPVSRERPAEVTGPTLNDARTEPSPDWNGGETVRTSIEVVYNRYFRPTFAGLYEQQPDGLAIKVVTQNYTDPEAILTEGEQRESYDGSAFSSAGDANGNAIPGDIEPGAFIAQAARYEVLGRYRTGAQAMRIRVRRADVPGLRVGDWCPAVLSWFPNTATNLRGLDLEAVQVLSIDNSECAWLNLLIEAGTIAAPPGYFDSGEVLSDEASAGYFDDGEILSDDPA